MDSNHDSALRRRLGGGGLMVTLDCPFCNGKDCYESQSIWINEDGTKEPAGYGKCMKCGKGGLSCPQARGHLGESGTEGFKLEPYQVRVIQEKKELDEKIERLNTFLDSDKKDKIDFEELNLLLSQRDVMEDCSIILERRIELFLKKEG